MNDEPLNKKDMFQCFKCKRWVDITEDTKAREKGFKIKVCEECLCSAVSELTTDWPYDDWR